MIRKKDPEQKAINSIVFNKSEKKGDRHGYYCKSLLYR